MCAAFSRSNSERCSSPQTVMSSAGAVAHGHQAYADCHIHDPIMAFPILQRVCQVVRQHLHDSGMGDGRAHDQLLQCEGRRRPMHGTVCGTSHAVPVQCRGKADLNVDLSRGVLHVVAGKSTLPRQLQRRSHIQQVLLPRRRSLDATVPLALPAHVQ